MLHERLNPLTQQGGNRAIAMLFPWKECSRTTSQRASGANYAGGRSKRRNKGHYLVDDHAGGRIFALRPDLLLTNGSKRIVADTKWKLINEGDRANKYGITQADMYQLFAYGRKILAETESPVVVLIYPRSARFWQPLSEFTFEQDGCQLLVLPFDLDTGQLIGSRDFLPSSFKDRGMD